MKNGLLPLPLAVAVAAMLTACTNRPVQPRFDRIVCDTLLRQDGRSCNVSYRFVSIANAAESPALQEIERADIGYFFQLEEFAGSAGEAVRTSLEEIAAACLTPSGGAEGFSYDISAESEASVVDTLLCYTITRSSYTGGAHGIYATECHTYSLTDGFELSLADLFTGEQLQRLDALIRAEIRAQYGVRNDEELAGEGFFPEYIAPTENFRITPSGIVFHYNPYEIACYAAGSVEVALDRETLEELRR